MHVNMFKGLRQRIGQGLTADSGRSPSSVAHGQVGHALVKSVIMSYRVSCQC